MKIGDRVVIAREEGETTRSAMGRDVCPDDPASCGCVPGDVGIILKEHDEDGVVRISLVRDPESMHWWIDAHDLDLVPEASQ